MLIYSQICVSENAGNTESDNTRDETDHQQNHESASNAVGYISAIGFAFQDAYKNVFRFDEALDTFRTFSGTQISLAKISPQATALRKEVFLLSSSLTRAIDEAASARQQTARDIPSVHVRVSKESNQANFLAKAVAAFDYDAAKVALEFQGKTQSVYTYAGLRFQFWLPDGSIITQDALSFGQTRMLALLYYFELNPHFIVVDESVNGLHRSVDRVLYGRNRQPAGYPH